MTAIETIRFPVAGMTCSSCVGRITSALRSVDGVVKVDVDLRRETAIVRRAPSLTSNAVLAAALERTGYQADLDAAEVVPTFEQRNPLKRLIGR